MSISICCVVFVLLTSTCGYLIAASAHVPLTSHCALKQLRTTRNSKGRRGGGEEGEGETGGEEQEEEADECEVDIVRRREKSVYAIGFAESFYFLIKFK